MPKESIINWLLAGDISIQYQTHRDLMGEDNKDLQLHIAHKGWGKAFLDKRKPNGHWGKKFYQPKWTSTHYTLLDLKNLNISPDIPEINKSIRLIAANRKSQDGGINPAESIVNSDVCVNGMFLNYASYFKTSEKELKSVIDFLLTQKMQDGGYNCCSNRSGAVHSSMHTTLSVMEGYVEYLKNGYSYKKEAIKESLLEAKSFLLIHRLFLSDRTGEIIHPEFLKIRFPRRWKYDIVSALDLFQYASFPWDERMQPALEVLIRKRNKDGTWNLQAKLPGALHFEMEKPGKPSRWNTLRALRILKHYYQKPLFVNQPEQGHFRIAL
ncbi:hypothetical protein LVD13_08530 [Flavobacteriaceae bacterium D16]|nr:hypothetical protein [Flavobacteriaceae bacterium D16]